MGQITFSATLYPDPHDRALASALETLLNRADINAQMTAIAEQFPADKPGGIPAKLPSAAQLHDFLGAGREGVDPYNLVSAMLNMVECAMQTPGLLEAEMLSQLKVVVSKMRPLLEADYPESARLHEALGGYLQEIVKNMPANMVEGQHIYRDSPPPGGINL